MVDDVGCDIAIRNKADISTRFVVECLCYMYFYNDVRFSGQVLAPRHNLSFGTSNLRLVN